jgi:hypothetical protein
MEIGDLLIGNGATHLIETLTSPPGPNAISPTALESKIGVKTATRRGSVVVVVGSPAPFSSRRRPSVLGPMGRKSA